MGGQFTPIYPRWRESNDMPYKDKNSVAAKESQSKRNKKHYRKHKSSIMEKKKPVMKQYYQKNKENYKKYWWNRQKKVFGVDEQTYNKMLFNQNNCCAICGRNIIEIGKTLHIDHDHKTGLIRGLLCYNCNAGLGNFKDLVESLKNAITYLKN